MKAADINPANSTSEVSSPHTAHDEHDAAGNSMFGFITFLLSESVIFFSFFAGYIVYKTTAVDWLPAGIEGLEVREPTASLFYEEKSFELKFGGIF